MNVHLLVVFFRCRLPVLWPVPPVTPMSESREVSRVECRCDRRLAALAAGDFVFWPHAKVWVFTEGPFRSMSAHARIGAFVDRREFKHEDHDGEPYSWVSCPWCGHDLPNCSAPRIVWPQADGEEGG